MATTWAAAQNLADPAVIDNVASTFGGESKVRNKQSGFFGGESINA